MGKNKLLVEGFIASIPDNKFNGTHPKSAIIFRDERFRLDLEVMTGEDPPRYKASVHINENMSLFMQKETMPTLAAVTVPDDESMSPAQVKEALVESITV